jgi:phospholipid/cholesterol/gamma-HCH transport system substrate-binding protein
LVQTEKKLAPLLDKLNSVADSVKSMELAQVTKNLNQNLVELRGITSAINKGEGTLGLLIKSDTVHQRIDSLLLTLNSVLLDLKQSPKKYLPPISVFGKKDKTSKKKE